MRVPIDSPVNNAKASIIHNAARVLSDSPSNQRRQRARGAARKRKRDVSPMAGDLPAAE
jgi:hypothetical protein